MSDNHTSEQRHRNMAAIRGKNTRPEMIVRRWLWGHGFRYRLNDRRLPGKPDIVLKKYKTCIFINGCFWHGHNVSFGSQLGVRSEELGVTKDNETTRPQDNESDSLSSECCKIPRTNREFWVRKIMRNQERDLEVQHKLARMGWHCITIWECELREHRSRSEVSGGKESLLTVDRRPLTAKRNAEQTLEALGFTLNEIYLQDRRKKYEVPEEVGLMAAESELVCR